jgi:hypothetical protein
MCKKLIYLVSFVLVLGLANNAFAEIPRDPNLVIYYSYEDVRAIVPDESGKGHDGTVFGDVTKCPSGIEWYGAAKFLGELGPAKFSYLDLDGPRYPVEDCPKSAITLAAWCKCQNTGGQHAIFNALSSTGRWLIHPEVGTGGFRWTLRSDNPWATICNFTTGTVTWDEWQHYAGTYDKASRKAALYINGQMINEVTTDPNLDIAGDWKRGAQVGYNIGGARPFTGLMDEFYMFTRALSQAEIGDLMYLDNGLPSEKASHPKPGNGTELETTGTDLLWLKGAYAASHDVYFGTVFADVNAGTGGTSKGNQTEAKFTVAGLVPGTTYYWRIDEVNGVKLWPGDVWSFWLRPQTAWNPNPPDGAKFIVPDADLSWSPGWGAVLHDVYFGTDQTKVADGTGGTFKSIQPLTTYDPGLLEFEKVYYWRVDEHDSGGTKYPGAVWRFTTFRSGSGVRGQYYNDMTLTNLVLTRLDPGINFNWRAAAPDPVVNANNFSVRWTGDVEAEFTETYTFYTCTDNGGVRLWVNDQQLVNRWVDQSYIEWSGTINLTAGQKYSIVMEYYQNIDYARAELYWQSPSQPKQVIPQGAFSLPLRARHPRPAWGATDVEHTPKLMWVAGERAAKHDVYFGTNPTPGLAEFRGQQTATSYVPTEAPLQWNTIYYWRIDEVNGVDLWPGSVWSFTTADFLVVDDFEDYNETTPNKIWENWIDGLGVVTPYIPGNGTGSIVGYSVAGSPYAETRAAFVHGGAQSMPMAYDNNTTTLLHPYYSETERTLDANWTNLGVKSLTVWFKGTGTNTAEPLYVAVEDSDGTVKVVTHADPNAVLKTTWQEWNIPLKTFSDAGVSLNSIKKMYIGVGNRDLPARGGTGTIYIDDIRLYRPRCMANKPLGDFSNDCVVDYADLDVMVDEWLNTVPPKPALATDLNGDKKVDLKDYAVLAQHWLEVVALWP